MQVAVLVCTYKRPLGLKKLVASLAQQSLPEGIEPILCLADNNPTSEQHGYIKAAMQDFPWRWLYRHETKRGYASARNASLDLALSKTQAELLCITDDDEVVPQTWIKDLVAGIQEFDCQVIVGA